MKEKEIERLNLLKQEELKLYSDKIQYICGIDEAGRGPLAGPVVVGAVILPEDSFIEGVNDSKKVSEKKRERVYEQIIAEAISYGVGIVDQKTIDELDVVYNACASAEKERLSIPGAAHGEASWEDPELYWSTVDAFLAKHMD